MSAEDATSNDTTNRAPVRVEPGQKRVRAYLEGVPVVDSTRVRLVWEQTSYPAYYFPMDDVRTDLMYATGQTRRSATCGDAHLYDVRVGARVASDAAYRHV